MWFAKRRRIQQMGGMNTIKVRREKSVGLHCWLKHMLEFLIATVPHPSVSKKIESLFAKTSVDSGVFCIVAPVNIETIGQQSNWIAIQPGFPLPRLPPAELNIQRANSPHHSLSRYGEKRSIISDNAAKKSPDDWGGFDEIGSTSGTGANVNSASALYSRLRI